MKNLKSLILILSVISSITISCKKEIIEPEIIRPLIYLTTDDIAPFENMNLIFNDNFPISVGSSFEYSASSINFRWDDVNKEYLQVAVFCTESHDKALNLLNEFKNGHCLSLTELESRKDVENIIGDQSYLNGELFIRDNLVVQLFISENFSSSVNEIAKSIDKKILDSQTFSSITEVKPKFENVEFKNNPIPANTKLDYTFVANDPQNLHLTYILRFEGLVAPQGFSIDPKDVFYNPDNADPSLTEVGLEIFTYNELGFYSDTIIHIQVMK